VTAKVHGYHQRRVADTPAGGGPVVIEPALRRLVCANLGCPRQTFREQVPGLAERYARLPLRWPRWWGGSLSCWPGGPGRRC
jgi:hypothetical protein